MQYELWVRDREYKLREWSFIPVDGNYDLLRKVSPGLVLDWTVAAASYEEAMTLAHEYLGLPPYHDPFTGE
jgi:hypothetical protein